MILRHGTKLEHFIRRHKEIEMSKIKVKSIMIVRGEGPSDKIDKGKEFDSFKNVNLWLISEAYSFSKLGYDKHYFKIEWEDGRCYEGRLDCMHPENTHYDVNRNSLSSHVKGHAEFWVKDFDKITWIEEPAKSEYLKYFKELLDNYELYVDSP